MITVQNLNYTYPGQKMAAINNITFEVKQGEIFGFLGPSGAGKSTTQKILMRLLKGYKGDVLIGGKPLDKQDQSYFHQIGVCFELPNHYPQLTALENLSYFASFYDKKTIDPLHFLGMVGLEQHANIKTAQFSKGMKMRLNFIRAIQHDPDIVFLDEPTSGLDPANASNIKKIIRDLKAKGKTIFLTTHNMHDAEELCDRVAFLNAGKIALTDTPANLRYAYGKRTLKVEYGSNNMIHVQEFDLDSLAQSQQFLNIIQTEHIRAMHSCDADLNKIFMLTTGTALVQS